MRTNFLLASALLILSLPTPGLAVTDYAKIETHSEDLVESVEDFIDIANDQLAHSKSILSQTKKVLKLSENIENEADEKIAVFYLRQTQKKISKRLSSLHAQLKRQKAFKNSIKARKQWRKILKSNKSLEAALKL